MENPRYDRQLRAMLMILENDYAGTGLNREVVDSRYYIQAAGMAWKEGKLDALTFLRFGSQMLATTLDRSLRLRLEGEDYVPWRPGFDVRRVGEDLFVTALQEETRLAPGDRILRLNAISPGAHQAQFQKNFLYAREPEREMWGNVLKMAGHMLVEHLDGTREDLPLNRFTGKRPQCPPSVREAAPGVVCLNVGDLGQGELLEELVRKHQSLLDGARRLIIDLRQANSGSESGLLPLAPYVLGRPKTMSQAAGLQALCTLYTKDNCRRRSELLSRYAGIAEADEELAHLKEMEGAGWVEETLDLWEDMPETIHPRGGETLILTDSFCEGAAESFALLAKKEGRARLIGRATRGTLDYAGMISVRLCDAITFTYPMSITRDAREGRGFRGKGVQPDVSIPFTPAECTRDVILERALGL